MSQHVEFIYLERENKIFKGGGGVDMLNVIFRDFSTKF